MCDNGAGQANIARVLGQQLTECIKLLALPPLVGRNENPDLVFIPPVEGLGREPGAPRDLHRLGINHAEYEIRRSRCWIP